MALIGLITSGHLSTNPRLVKEAKALSGEGQDVRVIATSYLPWARECDEAFNAEPWKVQKRIEFGPEAPYPIRLVQAMRRRLARLAFAWGAPQGRIARAAWHEAAPDLANAAKRMRADLYIAHYPAALPAAAAAAMRHGARYAFDAEDFHLGDLPDVPEHELERRLIRAIEGRYLSGCAYVSAASPGIADAYAQAYGIERPTVMLNVFPRSYAPSGPTPVGSAFPRPSLYWFSQTIGPDRGLECAIGAIARARCQPHLYLRGSPSRGYLERLHALASESGAGNRLHILRPAPPAEMERLAASYDVGFVGETGHTRNRRIALTNKLFSYLLAGLPVVVSDIPAHRSLAADLGVAGRLFRTDDPDALAAALDDLLCDPAVLAEARWQAYQLGQSRFNWDTEQRIFLDLVERALGPASAPADAPLRSYSPLAE